MEDVPIILSLDPDDATVDRWKADRARHIPFGSRARPGYAKGSLQALDGCRAITLICKRCSALVHWHAARRQAKRAGRSTHAPGDGCGSRTCARFHHPSRFARRQQKMIDGLRNSSRALATWPKKGLLARKIRIHSVSEAEAALGLSLAQ